MCQRQNLTCGLRVSGLRSATSYFVWTSHVAFEPVFPLCDLHFSNTAQLTLWQDAYSLPD